MKLLSNPTLSDPESCPYIDGQESTQEYFFGFDAAADEMEFLLSTGWRKFGYFFFRPNCKSCQQCIPLRVLTNDFLPSKSQRKILKKNQDLEFKITPLTYRQEIYELYLLHSKRFPKKDEQKNQDLETPEQFIESHFQKTTKSYLSEFLLNGELIACGFLDESSQGLSSVYFIYDPKYSKRSLGTLGALLEIEYAKQQGLAYYYLGYFIEENNFMNYKANFRPHELLDWKSMKWQMPKSES